MAHRDYEEDEFDRAAAAQPAGAHRQPVSRMKLAWPFLVAVVLAPILAWGVVTMVTSFGGNSKQAEPAATQTTQAPEPTPTVDLGKLRAETNVTVYNAAGISGMAGRAAEKLKAESYQKVNPTNASGRGVEASIVYFTNEDVKPLAEDTARILGIEAVAAKPDGFQIPDGVVVYLLKGYQDKQ